MGEDDSRHLDPTAALEHPMPTTMHCVGALLICTIEIFNAAKAAGLLECTPILTFKDIRFSEMQKPTLERKWTATVSVDASRCQENSSGYFDVIFTDQRNRTQFGFSRAVCMATAVG
jgi:hypothetical protein